MSYSSPNASSPFDGAERIPSELRNRMIVHGQEAPYHRSLQDRLRKEEGMEYADIHTWDDLRTVFDHIADDDLRDISAEEFFPDHYHDDTRVHSRSSGTTGEPKESYWHEEDVQDNVDYVEAVLREQGVDDGQYWVGTVTPNDVLRTSLEELAERFNGDYTILEVDPTPIKRALQSGDEQRIQQAFHDVAKDVVPLFEQYDVGVYEDIAPMMQAVGQQLSPEQREQVDTLLIGGVGTTEEMVDTLTSEVFDDAMLSGWYGDYNTGLSMMTEPGVLMYRPNTPDVRFEVRDFDDIRQRVADGGEGALVAHTIRRGFFVPNRIIGDKATRIAADETDIVTDIGRMEE